MDKAILAMIKYILLGVALSLTGWGVFIWLAGARVLPQQLGLDYYRDFNIARDAVEESPCATSIEFARHEDVTLESFHFKISTESGWLVRLWFREGMDVREICSDFPGIIILHPHNWKTHSQAYSNAELSMRLASRGIKLENVNDVLCNMGLLGPLFRAEYDNQDIPRVAYGDEVYNRYLWLEIVETGRGREFLYTRIR